MDREEIIRMVATYRPREAGISDSHAFGMFDFLERFAALVAAAEREKSLRLWMLLDDVDTADDIAKADHEVYRSLCRKAHQKRWEILSEEEVDAAIRARGNT